MHSFERKLSPLSNGVYGKVVQRIGRELFDLNARGDIFLITQYHPVNSYLAFRRRDNWFLPHRAVSIFSKCHLEEKKKLINDELPTTKENSVYNKDRFLSLV